ncbi:hypothetical protein AeNC1_019260, partial [Aphanomyces euteiches]
KTKKLLEEREKRRIRREREEAKHRAPGYEPPEGSDVSTNSELSEEEQERDKAMRKERKRQALKAEKKRSLKMFLKAVVYRIDPPGLSNLLRFELKREPIDSITAFAKLIKLHMDRIEASDRVIEQQEQMEKEKRKRSPPMG